jgi:hypothetical protein
VQVEIDGAQRADKHPPKRNARVRNNRRLETAMASQPSQLGRLRTIRQRPSDGESRVDMSARAPGHYQKTH